MLESAGFSQSNPYYIVQQGRVQELCTMRDTDRLAMLKRVAGTSVYDAKRQESLHILEENLGKRSHIDEVIAYLEERLRDLSAERSELTAWQALDRRRRAIEYALHSKELATAKRHLDDLAHVREEEAGQEFSLQAEMTQLSHDQAEVAGQLEVLQARLKAAQEEREALTAALAPLTATRVQTEGAVAELRAAVAEDVEGEASAAAALQRVRGEMQGLEEQLATALRPAYAEAEAAYVAAKAAADANTADMDALYERAGRSAQFDSAEARDAWIAERSAELQSSIRSKESGAEAAAAEAADATAQRDRCLQEAAAASAELAECQSRLQVAQGEAADVRAKLGVAVQEARVAHSTLDGAERRLAEATDSVGRCRSAMDRLTPPGVRTGLAELKRLVEEEGWTGIHGPVLDIVRAADSRFDIATEVIGRNQLFNVVVDNVEVAARCITHLTTHKRGRVTFIPLDAVDPPAMHVPANQEDCLPLMDKLTFEEHLKPAVLSVFGRALLCRDLTIARKYAAESGMNCVTLDGDEVSGKGVIYGGFQSVRENRLANRRSLQTASAELDAATEAVTAAQQTVLRCDQASTALRGQLEALTERQASARKRLEECRGNEAALTADAAALTAQHERATARAARLTGEVEALSAQLASLQEELGTALMSGMPAAQRKQLVALQSRAQELAAGVAAALTARDAARAAKAAAEAELTENLRKQEENLLSQMSVEGGGTGGTGAEEASGRRADLAAAEEAAAAAANEEADTRRRLGTVVDNVDTLQGQVAECQESLEGINSNLSGIADRLARTSRHTEKILQKRATAVRQRDAAMRAIRALGALPAELGDFEGKSRKVLLQALEDVSQSLKAFDHVNKKALDQFANFSEQREALVARREELARASSRIHELVAHLDAKKDEAILRTFKGVARHFKAVFAELVPKGSGTILIKRSIDPADEDEDVAGDRSVVTESFAGSEAAAGAAASEEAPASAVSSDIARLAKRVDSFRGVAIKVSFTDAGESQNMKRLSGGQKALVALALIFAIQRCDPAPFYLFDEIDAALDDTHRAAVANLVHRQSLAEENPAQFITSTFRPELVHVADAVYGVLHQHGVSHVITQSREEALAFIHTIHAEGGGVAPQGTKTPAASNGTLARLPTSAMADLDDSPAKASPPAKAAAAAEDAGSSDEEGAALESKQPSPPRRSKRSRR